MIANNPHIPDRWQVVRLGDVCTPPEYGANAPARPFDTGLPRFVRITDITDDGRLRINDARSAEPAKVRGYELGVGDLLFARSGSVGRTYLYRPEDGPCVFAGYLIRFQPNPDIAVPRFVEIYTHSASYHRWVASMLRVGAQPNINATEYSSLPILLPPLPEQWAIAAVLDTIDEAIEGAEAVITATERLRDALLHELLTRGVPGWHTQWKDVPGIGTIPADWEVVRLGDGVTHVGSGVTPRGGKSAYTASGITFLRSQNVHFDGLRLEDVVYIPSETDNAMVRSRVQPDDVLLNITGASIGRCTVAPGGLGPANVNQHVCIIRTSEAFNERFVAKWLSTPRSQREIDDVQTGQSRQGLNYQQVRQLTIARPSRAEQDYIAAALDGVDDAIEQVRRERNGLQLLKASAADVLLSGRVRVKVS